MMMKDTKRNREGIEAKHNIDLYKIHITQMTLIVFIDHIRTSGIKTNHKRLSTRKSIVLS